MIRVDQLRKRYGSLVAVDGISFEIDRGETFGLLGPNGAGKTTTIHLLIGALRPAVVLSCNAICFVGISMLLASAGKTEEAVGGSSSAVMLIMMMLGGAMVPRFVMPAWLQNLSHISPIKWAILSVEGATWRDFSYLGLLPSCGVLLATGAVCMGIGILLLRRSQG